MTRLHQLAALSMIAGGMSPPDDLRDEVMRGDWDDVLGGPRPFMVIMGDTARGQRRQIPQRRREDVTYCISPKPLTKRQKRRLRGKSK